MPMILVVDDDKDILNLAKIMLESYGFRVIIADSGEEAFEIIAGDRPVLVLLDAVMPGLNGLDVCRTLKRSEDTRDIPVIIFTALLQEVDLTLVEGDKADGYLRKPFTSKTLIDAVECLLGREVA